MSTLIQRSYVVVMPQHSGLVGNVVAALVAYDITIDPKEKWGEHVFPPRVLAKLHEMLPGILVERREIEERPYIRIGVTAPELRHRLWRVQSVPMPGYTKIPGHKGSGPIPNRLSDVCAWPDSASAMEDFMEFFGQP